MTNSIQSILIVGGGSAGWLTAAILAAEYNTNDKGGKALSVTLIESSEVATLGVGEGTWPSMRSTLKIIGVSEADFLNYCEASFKQGSKFVGWQTGASDSYLHPFNLPIGYGEVELAEYWEQNKSKFSFADAVCVQGRLAEKKLAPKRTSAADYSFNVNYGYHLDASKFGQFLKEHCVKHLGVKHIVDHVVAVNNSNSGDIESLSTQTNGDLFADIFVDCSGFAGLLIDKHYKVNLVDQSHFLFNDSALALHVPYQNMNDSIESFTLSTAQSSGWIWDIGLSCRRGVGYTYSSRHIDDESAEAELLAYVKPWMKDEEFKHLMPRKIKFKPGYREKFWYKNCVAIGVSAGFIEPLEASALALIELSAKMLANQLPPNKETMPLVAERFNNKFSYHWKQIIEFLKLHYVLSRREDSQYWRDNRSEESIPEYLREQLALWKYKTPGRYDFTNNEELFPSASYQYVLYGMGFTAEEQIIRRRQDNSGLAMKLFNENYQMASKLVGVLPTNRDYLNNIKNLNSNLVQTQQS